jgi:hypothetical protein
MRRSTSAHFSDADGVQESVPVYLIICFHYDNESAKHRLQFLANSPQKIISCLHALNRIRWYQALENHVQLIVQKSLGLSPRPLTPQRAFTRFVA